MNIVCQLKKHSVLLIIILFYFMEILFLHPVFGINDDWTVYSVLSGAYTGTPEAHVLFLTYPLSLLLSGLYQITGNVPWYGLFLQGSFVYCLLCLYYRSAQMIENKTKKILISFLFSLLFLMANLEMLTMIQYTVTAGACGAAAVFMFFTSGYSGHTVKDFLKQNIHTFILALLSVSIRQNAFYVLLPVAGMLWLFKWLSENKPFANDTLKKYFGFAAILAAVLVSNLFVHRMAYGKGEWLEYDRANHYREQIMDFYGWADYNENEWLMEEAGLTRERYQAMSGAVCFYNGTMPLDQFLKRNAQVSQLKYDQTNKFADRISQGFSIILESFYNKDLYPINAIVAIGYVFVLSTGILCRKRKVPAAFACFLTGRLVSWMTVLYNGRFPVRIPQLLFIMDFFVMMAFILYFQLYHVPLKKKVFKGLACTGLVFLILFIGLTGLKQVYHKINDINYFNEDWEALKDYCEEHPQNQYVWSGGSGTLKYFSDRVFDAGTSNYQNYILISSLYSISPLFKEKAGMGEQDDIADRLLEEDHVYWVFEKGTLSEDNGVMQLYQKEHDDFKAELIDTFTLKNLSYEIYRFCLQNDGRDIGNE